MTVWAGIRNLSFRQLLILAGAFLSNPKFLSPTFKATVKTLHISNRLFGKIHHGNNRANAFRHALWNYLICLECANSEIPPEKALIWSKQITDLHEELLPNDELARIMDLHNNEIGRNLFSKFGARNLDVVPVLKEMMKDAQLISSLADIKELNDQLVFTEKLKENERKIL